MSEFPLADIQTTERLLNDPERLKVSAEILCAVVAFIVGGTGAFIAAAILREWADKIEAHDWPAPPPHRIAHLRSLLKLCPKRSVRAAELRAALKLEMTAQLKKECRVA